MGNAPILDLDALVPDRPSVRIRTADNRDGKLWELKVRSELSIIEIQKIMRLSEKAESKQNDEMTAETMQLLSDSLDELLVIVLVGDYEGELQDVLTIEHKVALAKAFTSACLTTPSKQARARKASTGAK